MNWTPEVIEQMFAAFRAGHSASAIARQMNTTKGSIIGMYYRERIRRGLIPPPPSDSQPRPNRVRRKQMLTLPARAESVSAYVAPKPQSPDLGQVADIVGVTGCREPVAEGPEFVGGHGFCNHATADGLSYCPYHQRQNVASYSRKLISKTLGAFGLRFGKAAA